MAARRSAISRAMKGLAKRLSVPVILLSQLNRELYKRMDKRPILSDLRESGAIEQDADVVMLLHREAVARRGDEMWMEANPSKINEATLILSKQRNGASGVVKLTFLEKCTRFENYNPGI